MDAIKSEAAPATIYLSDYLPPAYLIEEVNLQFELDPEKTKVLSQLKIKRNPASKDKSGTLILNGQDLEFVKLTLDGKLLNESQYELNDQGISIHRLPEAAVLEIENYIAPIKNTAL